MLDSFRDLNARVIKRDIDWVFLEVRGRVLSRGARAPPFARGRARASFGWRRGAGSALTALCPSPESNLQVHAEGEAEHAAIGHNAVLNLVPAAAEPTLRRAMADHDRDFAAFYNRAADMLEA
jgi:hypothetical protein